MTHEAIAPPPVNAIDAAEGEAASSRSAPRPTRIVVLGGGFAGSGLVSHFEHLFRGRDDIEIVLVDRDNFVLMTPFLFEACSGSLELRHCSVPLRDFLRKARFIEATVERIDLDQRIVYARAAEGRSYELPYDQLVLALGSITNMKMIPGSSNAFTFKSLADAVVLRNHLIERFERADAETDADRKRTLLTFVVIGGGLVGVELFGELTDFTEAILRYYPRVRREELRFHLLEAADRVLPEVEPPLAEYARKVLQRRSGVEILTNTPVRGIEPEKVRLDGRAIDAATIVLSAGILPSPVVSALPLEKSRRGNIIVAATLRCGSHPEVWAMGDCAQIPDPSGKPYPALAQHATREAHTLARNLHAVLSGRPPQPFIYGTLGVMGSLGHYKGFGKILGLRLHGFPAWWVRRSYYLLQLPGWSRRFRVMVDWTFALLFRPDIVKIDTADERGEVVYERAAEAMDGEATPPRFAEARHHN